LWSGRPHRLAYTLDAIPLAVFGVVWLALPIGMWWMITPMAIDAMTVALRVFLVPFFLAGIWMVAAPVLAFVRAATVEYGVTSSRVLIRNNRQSRRLTAIPRSAIGAIHLRRNGIDRAFHVGTIEFDVDDSHRRVGGRDFAYLRTMSSAPSAPPPVRRAVGAGALVSCALGALLGSEPIATADAAAPARDRGCWRMVAASDIVVAGRLRVPAEEFRRARDDAKWPAVDLSIDVRWVIKGDVGAGPLTVRYVPHDYPHGVPPDVASRLDGKDVVAFLVIDASGSGSERQQYFTWQSRTSECAALMELDEQRLTAIRNEFMAQQAMVSDPQLGSRDATGPQYGEVKALIGRLLKRRSQDDAIRALLSLRQSAIPSIVLLMDDRRKLPQRHMAVKGDPDSFEGLSLYQPETVLDALDVVLHVLSGGEAFGNVKNGATEPVRRRVLSGWRVYLDHRGWEH